MLLNFWKVAQCQHIFCAACLHEWLLRVSACPIDRKAVTRDQLTAAPRLCTNMLSRLQIACDYAPHGCKAFVKLEKLPEHVRECEHNPNPVHCAKGCGILVPKNNLEVCTKMNYISGRNREFRIVLISSLSIGSQLRAWTAEYSWKTGIKYCKNAVRNAKSEGINTDGNWESHIRNSNFEGEWFHTPLMLYWSFTR